MTDAPAVLERIVAWAHAEPNVRALVLVGSRAGGAPVDDLADIDLQVYAVATKPYTRDDAWLATFAPVWVCVHDAYRHGDRLIPTRLVLFDGGVKVDFALYPAAAVAEADPDMPARRALVDKDELVPAAPRPRAAPKPPHEEAFVRVVQEFWFEAYHVAKYLARGELWPAKARDWEAKAFLLTMIEWHARARQGEAVDTHYGGRHMRSWAEDDVWMDLHRVFAHFDAEDAWRALHATTALFRRLAKETAAAFKLTYPDAVEQPLAAFIVDLEQRRPTGRGETTA